MTYASRVILAVSVVVLVSGCDFERQADAKFEDQSFKTSISLIELYKTRFGAYPNELSDLRFTGAWDAISLNCVEYHRLDNGYELNFTPGLVSPPKTLSYPKEFWQGLGLVKSNLKPD